jgi:hypothetical protein
MKLRELLEVIKDGGYKQMTEKGLDLSQAYAAGEQNAKEVKMSATSSLCDFVRSTGGEIHYIDFAQFQKFYGNTVFDDKSRKLKFFENSIYVHDENNFDIVLSMCGAGSEQRYTIAHELGHYALHSGIGKCFALRRGDGAIEKEAHCFALGFLLPTELFEDACKKYNKDCYELSVKFLLPISVIKSRMTLLESKQSITF